MRPQLFLHTLLALAVALAADAAEGPRTIRIEQGDLQEAIDAAPAYSTLIADRGRQIQISRTVRIEKPLTLTGLNARLEPGLEDTPILEILAEGVRIREFYLVGNGDSVPQSGRAPLIVVRRGRFVIEGGETNNSAKDGVMITPTPEYGDIEHGVIRNLTSRGTIRDTVSIGGAGEQGLFVRHLVVENIRAYDSRLRGPVEVSDGSEYISVRDIYAESCAYGFDVQDHNREGQINRHVILDGLHVKNSRIAVRTANHDFGHDGLTIRNVTGEDWPADTERPFWVRHTSNLLIENVRLYGCPTGPCLHVQNSDGVTLRNITLMDAGHDGPGLLVEDSHDVLIDNVLVTGEGQPEYGVVYRINEDEQFSGLRIHNVVAPGVREAGVAVENRSESGRLISKDISGNLATTRE